MQDVRYAMIGGGQTSFIGPVHRAAIQLLGPHIRLVSGSFSDRKTDCDETAAALRMDPRRSYYDFKKMAEAEAALPEGERPHFIVIVTPNHLHYPVAKTFLEKGFSIFCEKPLTKTVKEAEELKALAKTKKALFGVMYGYTGYPMIKEARKLIRDGQIGKIRKVYVEYSQGWLTDPIEKEGQPQAEWRTEPETSGASLCLGDIGSHAENLVSYLTELPIKEISGTLSTFVPGRRLDDDAMVVLKLGDSANGVLVASQILCGELNNFRIRIYGDKGGIRWAQEEPERLTVLEKDGTQRILTRGTKANSKIVGLASYLPAGHPEGLIEAFSNHYRGFIQHLLQGEEKREMDYPTLEDGLRGMRFIECVVKNSKSDQKWERFVE